MGFNITCRSARLLAAASFLTTFLHGIPCLAAKPPGDRPVKRPDSGCRETVQRVFINDRLEMARQLLLAVERKTVVRIEMETSNARTNIYLGRILKVENTREGTFIHLEDGRVWPFAKIRTTPGIHYEFVSHADTLELKHLPESLPAIPAAPKKAERNLLEKEHFEKSAPGGREHQSVQPRVRTPVDVPVYQQIRTPRRVASRTVTPEPLNALGKEIVELATRHLDTGLSGVSFAMKLIHRGTVYHGTVEAIHTNSAGRRMIRLRLISSNPEKDIFNITKYSKEKGKETFISLPANELKLQIANAPL